MKDCYFPPRVSADTQEFWDGCREHKLVFQRCQKCGRYIWPASRFCSACGSGEVWLTEAEGRGRVYSFVEFARPFSFEFTEEIPYVVAAIDLDCGVTMISNIINCSADDVRCDLPVMVVFKDFDDVTLPLFEPETRGQPI